MALERQNISGVVILCEKCQLPLIQRLSNGIWKFKFGRQTIQQGNEMVEWIPIEFLAHGSLKLKCFRKSCGHWNTLNFLPNVNEIDVISAIGDRIDEIKNLYGQLPLTRKKVHQSASAESKQSA